MANHLPSGAPYSLHTPEDIARQWADKIRHLRLDRGWKQSTLAQRAGVSLASLRRFETSGQGSLKNVLRLIFALGRIDDLATVLEPPPARSIDELERMRDAPKRQRGSV